MKCKPQGRLFYTEKHVNKKGDFQTSQKMLEVQVKGQVAVIQIGKCFEGEKKILVIKRSETCGRIKNYDGEGGKAEKK